MLSTMTRPEDTVRGLRPYRGEADDEESEKKATDSLVPPPLSYNDGSPRTEGEDSRPGTAMGDNSSGNGRQGSGPKLLTQEETIDLARRAVESGILDTKRSLAGSEAVTDVVKPKLTIDLGHSRIIRIPEPVVDIIKDEVERYVVILEPQNLDSLMLARCQWTFSRIELIISPKGFRFQTTISSTSHTASPSALTFDIST